MILAAGAACGDDDDDVAPTSAPDVSASTYPVTVIDLLDRSVEITSKPESVVALSPTAAELVYAAGAELVGRASSVNYPERALDADEIGTAYQPSFEAILALEPDLVVADSVIHMSPEFRTSLESLGVTVIFAGAESYQNVLDGLTLMGIVFDASTKTDEIIRAIEEARDAARAAIEPLGVSALVLIGDRDQVLYAAKHNSYAGDILSQLGITNPAADQPDAGPFPGYTTVALEKLIEFDPAFIFTVTPAPPPAPRLSEVIGQIPPLMSMQAVSGGGLIELEVEWLLAAPGPRVIQAMQAITDAVATQ